MGLCLLFRLFSDLLIYRSVVKKLFAEDYPHLKLPAIVYAKVSAARKLDAFEWRELVIYNDESGDSYRAHIKANWYEYTLTVLDRFGSIDPAFPTLPQIRSRKQFKTGSIVAVALPYGELIPSIIGEVQL